jgi:hypothetical protein
VVGEYALPPVRLPGYVDPVEMRGIVVAPTDAPGRRPLVLFLHGRHATCYDPSGQGPTTDGWPCPAGALPVPSHRGYLYAQRLLASQGYLTVSIAANGVNGQDSAVDDAGAQARSSLVRRHLALWSAWSGAGRAVAPSAVRAAPRADLSRVLLVGHSRGGEGVNRAAMDSVSPPPDDALPPPVRWRIRGTVLIGPTIFGHNPTPDVPSLTILPGCDGDVTDLQGQLYVDGTRGVSRGVALHSAVYLLGANHNFFNSEWTPGQASAPAWDDFSADSQDPVCGTRSGVFRLTAQRQQAAGATYVAAAARLFIGGDDRVRPLLDGSGVRAPSADPARAYSHAVGAGRTPLLVPSAAVRGTGPGVRVCPQVHPDPAAACLPDDEPDQRSPHFAWFGWTNPERGRYAVALSWNPEPTPARPPGGGRGPDRRDAKAKPVVAPPDGAPPGAGSPPAGVSGLRLATPASVAGATALALRLIVPPNSAGTRLGVTLVDDAGRRAPLGEVRLDGLPGTAHTTSYWAQEARLPLAPGALAGVDPARIAGLELAPRDGAGRAWLLDAWGWRPGTPAARAVALPRVDLGELTVAEGDEGVRTYRMPVRASGRGAGQVRLFLTDPVTAEVTERVVTVRPGTGTVEVPVEVRGNTRYSYDQRHRVAAKAVHGAVVGDYSGGVTVGNDDPMPEITVTPLTDRVSEGGALSWRITLAADADADIWADFPVLAPADGTELSSADVDPTWFENATGEPPLPARPLSRAGVWLWATVPAGKLTAVMTVPTVTDDVAETEELLRIQLVTYPPGAEDPVPGMELTGTVIDEP